MDRSAIQEMLDSLDVQLASGKIDLNTYQALTTKWQTRLSQITNQAPPPPSVVEALATATIAVVCPECSAPLEDTHTTPGSVVRCAFCRATFTLQRAQESTERAGQELRHWLEQMVVDTSATGAVDAASRAFIFGEKLGPALQLEYRRAMEPYEDVQEHPLVTLGLLELLAGYRASENVLVRRSDGLSKVRALSVKVNSPLVAGFALANEDRNKLVELNLGTGNLVHLANVAQLLNQPSPEAYTAAKENLVALGKQYADYVSSRQEGGFRQFVQALRVRLDGNARVLEVLSTVFAPGATFSSQPYLEELDAAYAQLQEAGRLAETSGYNPLAVVPVRTGLEREEKTVQVIQALLRAYQVTSRSGSLTFLAFYGDMRAVLSILCPRATDPTEMLSAIEQVTTTVQGLRGQDVLRLVGSWEWPEREARDGARRGLFGGGEQVADQTGYWHPFWYATLQYSVAKGTVFVSGVEQSGYGLLDGMAGNAPAVLILNDSPLYSSVSQAIDQPRCGDGHAVLPPLASRAYAEQAIARAARAVSHLRNVRVRVDGLVYVPAVSAQYLSKSGTRQALYSYPLQASEAGVPLLGKLSWFFERYS